MRRALICSFICIILLTPLTASAQSPNTATLVVTVLDESGAVIWPGPIGG